MSLNIENCKCCTTLDSIEGAHDYISLVDHVFISFKEAVRRVVLTNNYRTGCMSKYFVSTFLVARTPTVSLTGERNGTFKFKRGIVLLKDEYIFCHPSIEPHSNTGDKMCAAALNKALDYLKLSFSEFKICFVFLRLNKRHLFRTITCERNNHIYTSNHNR